MKRISCLILAVSAVLLSCTPENVLQENDGAGLQTQELTISAGAATKTLLHEGKVKWENGDQIAVVFTHPTEGADVNREFSAVLDGEMAETADFQGRFSQDVSSANGYDENAFAVYPRAAVADDGTIEFDLPSEQTAVAGGSFPSMLNLSSSAISLSDVEDDFRASAFFRNALSYFRFNLDERVKGVTFTGTSPIAGVAPLKVYFKDAEDADHGRLLMDPAGVWSKSSTSIDFSPEEGSETFQGGDGYKYNLLVWPGSHNSLTITLDFGEGTGTYDIVKTFAEGYEFKPGKYYNVNFVSDPEQIVNGYAGEVSVVEADIEDVDGTLGDLEDKVEALGSQIQSISVLSEYTDNVVTAYYSTFSAGIVKSDIEISYLIRPASAAAAIVERYNSSNGILTGQVYYKSQSGIEAGTPLTVRSASLDGDVITVVMDASNLRDAFYSGEGDAEVALQVYDEATKTSVLSDNIRVVPQEGSGLRFTAPENMSVIKGSVVPVKFTYSLSSAMPAGKSIENYLQFNTTGGASAYVSGAYVTSGTLGGATVMVNIADAPVSDQRVDVVLNYGDATFTKTLTFSEGGTFEVSTLSGSKSVDYVGGEVTLVVNTTYNSYSSPEQVNGGDWLTFLTAGDGTYTYAAAQNDGARRVSTFKFTINTDTGINCAKSIVITQGQQSDGTSASYYSNGDSKLLKDSEWDSMPLNLLILGDGYQQKDLAVGGKFERSAVNAMNAFFTIEPFKSFEERFHVYMAAYQSNDEGMDNRNTSVTKDTYFNTYYSGATELWFGDGGMSKVQAAVNALGLSQYRTVAIILVNTDVTGGTSSQIDLTADNSSAYGEPYKGFGVGCVAANTTGFSGLVKHEVGGHAFGRLADEYTGAGTYTGNLTEPHNLGRYRNVCTDGAYWNDLINKGYSSYIGYHAGGLSCGSGIYRPTTTGIMYNNQGEFNAVCRRIIYERIIRQTEGANAYTLDKFVTYDKINLPE